MSAIVELEVVVSGRVDLFTLRAKLVDAIAATPGVELSAATSVGIAHDSIVALVAVRTPAVIPPERDVKLSAQTVSGAVMQAVLDHLDVTVDAAAAIVAA